MLFFERWKSFLILAMVFAGMLFAAPNLLEKETRANLPSFLPSSAMTLGLDLQGGSYILMQVDKADLVAGKRSVLEDDIRRILREAKIGYRFANTGDKAVSVTIREAAEKQAAREKLGQLARPVTAGIFGQGNVVEVEMTDAADGALQLALTDQGIANAISHAVTQSVEVITKRINELGTNEPIVQRQGQDRVLVQFPGLQDPQRLKDLIGQTAKLTFHLVSNEMSAQDALAGTPPPGTKILNEGEETPTPYLVETRALVDGENLVDAQPSYDQRTGEPVVNFRFDTKGATRFCQASSANVGRPFAIVLDEQIISAPVIREAICGGSGQISGNFSVEGANDLAVLLRAGALPAKLDFIEERTVGPGLGADSIAAGKIASLVATIGVVAFMFIAYGFLGGIANLALIANLVLIVALLSLIGATLTLPGIAGIVLTMGMAVDSNVLIYERVREEVRGGRSLMQSLDGGFRQAFATIIDSNLTTLIAALVLFYLGSGPVRGFAVTLAIGIVTTVFTAFTFTRLMVAAWVRWQRPKALPAPLVNFVPYDTKFGFMRFRNFAFSFSVISALAAVAMLWMPGLNFGVDFKGGTLIEAKAKTGAADLADIRATLGELNVGEVQVQEFGEPSTVLIRIGSQNAGDSAEQGAEAKARAAMAEDYDFRRVEIVGPTVSGELTRKGILAVGAALIAIGIYIWFRFEWQFALGAIIATAHDLFLTLGFFLLTQMEFSLTSIAAVLTIIGYSINDTVVIYDRIRENLRKYKKMPVSQLIDMSVNQTLSRTILTGASTFIALIALYLLGGEVLSGFTLAMIFGILVGTYSSVFVAAPVLILFNLRPGQVAGAGADDIAPAGAPGRT